MKRKIIKKLSLILFVFVIQTSIGQNNSLNFDGTDDYVSLGNNFGFDNTDIFTIEAWVKLNTGADFQQIISKLDADFTGWGLQIRPSSGLLNGYLFSTFSINQRAVRGSTSITDGLWHHVAMVYDANDIILYVDGALDPISVTNNSEGPLETLINSSNTHIGNYDGSGDGEGGEYFNGYIDEVRIWNVVRTETEIASFFDTELTGTEANLIAYYKMDDNNSTCDIIDCNSNETHGTRNGASGVNNLPLFTDDTPILADIDCGAEIDCSTLGVLDETFNEIKLFPNPTFNEINIFGFETENIIVEIHDILGKVLKVETISNQKINVSELPSGIFFLTIKSKNGFQITKRFIKK